MSVEKHKFTLLLVDDNPTNLLLLSKIIELDLPEVRVLTAGSATEGLQLARQERINGAFIDMQMPHMSGTDMCRRLNEDSSTAGLPVVLMTAHLATPEMRAAGLDVGAYDFISQPISNVEMLARIKVMLRLCEQERQTKQLKRGLQRQVDEQALRLRWISGLLLSGEGPLAEPDPQLVQRLTDVLPDPAGLDEQSFFARVTNEFPLSWRRTLLKLSLLDRVPAGLARELSEIHNIEAVFEYLHRHELALIESRNSEELLLFKPQSRDFLRLKARTEFDDTERQRLYQCAADWYQQHDDVASALRMLIAGKDHEAVAQLFSRFGLKLLAPDNGVEIYSLLAEIPDGEAAGCGWMALFKGIHCLYEQAADADSWLNLAYELFAAEREDRGRLLTLVQLVLLSLYQDGCFERWTERMPTFRELARTLRPVLELEERLKVAYGLGLAELFFAGDPAAAETLMTPALAEAQQQQLVAAQLDLNLLRALAELQQGRYLVAGSALEQALSYAGTLPETIEHGVLQVIACELLHAFGDLSGLRKQREMMQTCCRRAPLNNIFAPLLDYYEASLLLAGGELQEATETLEAARLKKFAAAYSHTDSRLLQLRGYCRALSGREAEAIADLDQGLKLRERTGACLSRLENLLFAGMTCLQIKHDNRALQYLAEGLKISRVCGEERYRAGFHAGLAAVHDRDGNPGAADRHLAAFGDLTTRHKTNFFWGLAPELLRSLGTLAAGTGKQQVLQPLLREYLCSGMDMSDAPVPLLQIRTLGAFRLQLEDKTFDLSQVGHASRQIFALLLVVGNQAMSLERMMGLLWPESSGSKARSSFDTAHSRLRKALEETFGPLVRERHLVLEKGMLSLRNIRLDKTAIETLIGQARCFLQRGSHWQAEHALWKIDEYWAGEFLAGFEVIEEVQSQREQLNQLRLEQIELLAELLLKRRQQSEAIRMLQRGLLLDPTQDAMVRRLLLIYRDRQDSRAAGLLLEKYRSALIREEYQPHEIDELIDALGGQWLTID